MKIPALLVTLVWLWCTPMLGQTSSNDPVDALRSPGWNYGFFVGGSQSFANTPSVQTFLIAGRIGRVLTHQLGSNALRGSFEMALDIIPINEFWIGGHAQYAGAIDPFIAKWNFTGGKTLSPYLAAVGGVVFSPSNLPPGNTSQVNFTSGAELGAQWFHNSQNSIDFAVRI